MNDKPTTICYFGLYRPSARALEGRYDLLWVGYLSTMVAPLARLFCRKPIVFNALDSWYDRAIRDREMHSKFSPAAWGIWLCDLLAFHLATVVLVESEAQKKFLAKEFHVNPKKLAVVFTGADPSVFFPDPSVKKRDRFTAVFRGMFLPATGVEYVIEAARILRDQPIDFIIIGWGPLLSEVKAKFAAYELSHATLMAEFLPPKVLRELMLSCHVMLGQFGNHPRLLRTIQHKTFEALALGMPYITRDSASNRELLTDGVNCLLVPPADASALAKKIMLLDNNKALRESLAKNARVTYGENCRGDVLTAAVLKLLETFKP
ncbi:MAG: glycosyltransferase [Candidatus Taylorbacteria bacterium]|nr:glycosyltransferase [Candidatus Taylorbacteria bacterium]